MTAKTYIYRNLHKDCYSVKYKGKVTQHCTYAVIERPSFQVSIKGRQKLLLEKRKNVHAYVVSESNQITAFLKGSKFTFQPESGMVRVSYYPYKYDYFVVVGTDQKVTKAELVYLTPGGVWALNVE